MIPKREIAVSYVILVAFAAMAVLPILGVLVMALTPASESSATFGIPSRLDFENLTTAWSEGRFSEYMRSSLIVSVVTVAVSSVLSIAAGYAFARKRFPGRTLLFYLMLIGLLVPFETYIIPLYYEMRDLGLTDTYASLILPQIAQSVSFGTFWMRTYFAAVPESLVEAARIDGAGDVTVLRRIMVPIARPAIISMVMLTFMWTWNDFLLSLVMITSEDRRTAPLALSFFQGSHLTQYSLLAAAATIVAAPLILLYAGLQRYFLRGMLSGAVKG
jgi:raffinose/stachyose/melibiose transport system permease protein